MRREEGRSCAHGFVAELLGELSISSVQLGQVDGLPPSTRSSDLDCAASPHRGIEFWLRGSHIVLSGTNQMWERERSSVRDMSMIPFGVDKGLALRVGDPCPEGPAESSGAPVRTPRCRVDSCSGTLQSVASQTQINQATLSPSLHVTGPSVIVTVSVLGKNRPQAGFG